jgi:hypothetical protein
MSGPPQAIGGYVDPDFPDPGAPDDAPIIIYASLLSEPQPL